MNLPLTLIKVLILGEADSKLAKNTGDDKNQLSG